MTKQLLTLLALLLCSLSWGSDYTRVIAAKRAAAGGGGSNGLLTGLVSYWDMDEASGTRTDVVSAYNLTATGTVGSTTGSSGNAASFTGSASNYLSTPNQAALQNTGDISGSCRVNFSVTTGTQTIYAKWGSGTGEREVIVRLTGGAIQLIWYASGGGSDVRITHSATINAATTYSIQWGRDSVAGEIFLAVNGTKETASSASANAFTEPVMIGVLNASSDPLNGWIDEVCIHSKVYDATDITNLQTLEYADFD